MQTSMDPVPPRIRDWIDGRLAGARADERRLWHLDIRHMPDGCSLPDFVGYVARSRMTAYINEAGPLKVYALVTIYGDTLALSLSVGFPLFGDWRDLGGEVWSWPWQYAMAEK